MPCRLMVGYLALNQKIQVRYLLGHPTINTMENNNGYLLWSGLPNGCIRRSNAVL
jgi:hypothetical protein